MLENFEKYLKKRKRQKMLKKAKLYAKLGLIVLVPVTALTIFHILKKKAKKKVKQAVKSKVQEGIDRKRQANTSEKSEVE